MKIGKKNIYISLIIIVIIFGFISSAYAITGSIGNARMILKENQDGETIKVGDKIEKYVLVKNVNEVNVDITLFSSGDLGEYVDIRDKEFTLAPGEEKKAYFIIEVKKGGTTETRINVQFSPEEGNGVGLSSTVIIIAEKSGLFDWFDNNEDEVDIRKNDDSEENTNMGFPVILLLTTTIVFFIFFVLLVIALKNKKGDKGGEIKQKRVKKR